MLGTVFNKGDVRLHTENHKILLGEIKEKPNKLKHILQS